MKLTERFPDLDLKQKTLKLNSNNLNLTNALNGNLIITDVENSTTLNLEIPTTLVSDFICFLIVVGENVNEINVTTTLNLIPEYTPVAIKKNQKVFIQKTGNDVYLITHWDQKALIGQISNLLLNLFETTDDLDEGLLNLYMTLSRVNLLLTTELTGINTQLDSLELLNVALTSSTTTLQNLVNQINNIVISPTANYIKSISLIPENIGILFLKTTENLENNKATITENSTVVIPEKNIDTSLSFSNVQYSLDLKPEITNSTLVTNVLYIAEINNIRVHFKIVS